MFQYLKNEISSNGVVFLQETLSCEKDKKSVITILKEHCSFRTEQQNLVELPQDTQEQNHLYQRKENGQKWSHFTSRRYNR